MTLAIDKRRLTQTQLTVADSIISTLDEGIDHQLILLEGLSGVGKSSLLSAIAEDIAKRGGAVIEPENYRYRLSKVVKAHAGPVIVPFVPREKPAIETLVRAYSGKVSTFLLKGWSWDEIIAHIRGLPETSHLTLERLVEYSLGIPFLAEEINRAQVTIMNALRMSATYLTRQIPPTSSSVDEWIKHLRTEPPDDVQMLYLRWAGYLTLTHKLLPLFEV